MRNWLKGLRREEGNPLLVIKEAKRKLKLVVALNITFVNKYGEDTDAWPLEVLYDYMVKFNEISES